MMSQSMSLQQRPEQRQILAPRMIHSMEILQLPILALQECRRGPRVSAAPDRGRTTGFAVSPESGSLNALTLVSLLSREGERKEGRSRAQGDTCRVSAGLAYSLWHPGPQRESLRKRRKNRGNSASSPEPLNGVNFRVAFSASKNQVPEWDTNWQHSG
jgi:hypothetical protein